MRTTKFGLGMVAGIAARALFAKLLRLKFERDLSRLNQGDYSSLLASYSDEFVLHFHEGEHRWSGDWIGRAGMERFLENFTAAGLRGQIRRIALSGPPWDMTLWARFDDCADAPDGTRIYENRSVLVLRTRWGKIIEQHDFYADTDRILNFEKKLGELGIDPVV